MAKNKKTSTVNRKEKTLEIKRKLIEEAMKEIKKDHGDESIGSYSEIREDLEPLPSGLLSLDEILGIGGIPKGRIIEVFGPEASGKTSLALTFVSQAQKRDLTVAYIDVEHAIRPEYCIDMGIDMTSMLYSQPSSGEEAFNVAVKLAECGGIDLIVIDSIAAMLTKAEIGGEVGDTHVSPQARLVGQGIKKLVPILSNNDTILICINQIREKIGVMFGNNEITPGGKALKFFTAMRIETRKIGQIKEGEKDIVGQITKIKTHKNKCGPPFKTCELNLVFGKGFSEHADVLKNAINLDIIEKSGAWFKYDGENIGQGQMRTLEYIEANPDFYEKIKKQCMEKMGMTKEEEGAEENAVSKPERVKDKGNVVE